MGNHLVSKQPMEASEMPKIPRNSLCDCGSGRKYKKCHGDVLWSPPPASPQELERMRHIQLAANAALLQRQNQQGLGRPIISTNFGSFRVIAVGGKIFRSEKWKTFHDFLIDYIIQLLDPKWFKIELGKPHAERHPIVQWFDLGMEAIHSGDHGLGELISTQMTGATQAFLNLSYNLYLIAHHSPPLIADQLLSTFISRLKGNSSDLIGKLFETYAAAAFLKAGFEIKYESDVNAETHVEFVAMYPLTKQKFSVEVKARHHQNDDESQDAIKRLRVGNKLNKALSKKARHTRVVMIEVNVPDLATSGLEGWPKEAISQIQYAENTPPRDGSAKNSAYVFVTNHAFHNNLSATTGSPQVLAAACNIPDFGATAKPFNLTRWLESKKKHHEMYLLYASMNKHYQIPSTFDGQSPEIAFSDNSVIPMQVGKIYTIPIDDALVEATLLEAHVLEPEKQIFGLYRTGDGQSFTASTPMTDLELAAWKQHPDTFFGVIQPVENEAKDFFNLGEGYYETYRKSSKDELLRFLATAPDIDRLINLSQNELAIVIAERLAQKQVPLKSTQT
jgi:hypothetical protein